MKGPIEYIKEAWVIYTKKENFIFFAKIMAVMIIISTPLGYLMNYLSVQNDNLLLLTLVAFLLAIFGIFINSTQYVSVLEMGNDEKEVFKTGFKKMWRFFLISFVLALIILGGMVLFIIPAIIFGIWYNFSLFLVMDKGLKTGQALKQSKIMVKGKFWKIFGRNIVFGLFGFLIGFILGLVPYAGTIIVSFLAPLFILPSYLLYRDLSRGFDNLGTV